MAEMTCLPHSHHYPHQFLSWICQVRENQQTRQMKLLYEPSSDSSEDSQIHDINNEEPCNPVEERKFIISMSKLLELFSTCKRCHRRATASVQQTVGTMVRVGAECEFCGFSWQWSSQPSLRNITAGNLAYSAGILFSGALSAKGFVFYSVWVWQLYQGELSIPTKLLSCSLPFLG